MGVGFYVDKYEFSCSWSYSSFHEFRKKLANSIGIDLEEMEGYRKRHPIDKEYVKVGYRSWDGVKSPLRNFLNHSDSDGRIKSDQCKMIAPSLKMILILWEDQGNDIHKSNGFSLVAAMEHCAEYGKDLIFC